MPRTLPRPISAVKLRSAIVFASAALLFQAVGTGTSVQALEIVNLGTLAPNAGFSTAYGVSDNRIVVGDATDADLNYRAFRYQTGSMTSLGTLPGGSASYGSGISADGSTIVGFGSISDGAMRGFRYASSTMTALNPLSGHVDSQANGVSANGSVTVGYSTSASELTRALRWSGASTTAEDLGSLATGGYSLAYGVSADGSTIVGYTAVTGFSGDQPFRWTSGGGMTQLTLPVEYGSGAAIAASGDGSKIVGSGTRTTGGNQRAFKWNSGVVVDLGTVGTDDFSNAYDISDDGFLVVGDSGVGVDGNASFWDSDSGQMHDLEAVLTQLNATGIGVWDSLVMATAVSGNTLTGYNIAGWGVVGGEDRAFLVTGFLPVPEPSTYVLCTIAAAVVISSVRLRRKR